MEKLPCSIFNDVLGPVMRGPSSSHVAGASRIAALVRQSFPEKVVKAVVDFDVNGALAASHTGHGSDMGFACGLMGMELSDSAADQYERLAKENGIDITYRILDYGAVHPGNYRMEITDAGGTTHRCEAISTGGGMVELQKYEGFPVSICGDFYELLAICVCEGAGTARTAAAWKERLAVQAGGCDMIFSEEKDGECLIEMKLSRELPEETLERIRFLDGVREAVWLKPVLPTHSRGGLKVPYLCADELMAYAKEHPMEAWEYGAYYESCRGGVSMETVWEQMDGILSVMEAAVEQGLSGTEYRDRILGPQAQKLEAAEKAGKLIPCSPLNSVIKCISAVMETKSSMGLIVAAPTCGSCGCLPGTVIGLARALGLSREEAIRGLFAAGLVGVFFAEEATFSAEVCGCQVECGAGSGLAAAAAVQMMGGDIRQCMDAASVALQNITGLACDPVGNRVEVPCLGKNVMGGSNALSSANMILAGYDKVIPLDETIGAIYEIGLSLPLELRCTFGGLGKTKTALEILEKTERHFQEG